MRQQRIYSFRHAVLNFYIVSVRYRDLKDQLFMPAYVVIFFRADGVLKTKTLSYQ